MDIFNLLFEEYNYNFNSKIMVNKSMFNLDVPISNL